MREPSEPIATGDPSATPVESGPEGEPSNPFEALRTRTVIPFAILGLIVLYVVFRIVAGLTPMDPDDPATDEIAAAIGFYGALALWILWACRRSGVGVRRLVGRVPDGYNWLPVIGLLVVAGVFSSGLWYVTAYGLSVVSPGMVEGLIDVSPALVDSVFSAVMWTLIAVVIAPLVEEVLFRGVLVNRWGVKWGLRTGIVASSVLFGVLHLIDTVGGTIFGLVTAVLYLRTRTLIVPIALHAANNAVYAVAELMFPSEGPLDFAAELRDIESMALPGLGMAAVTLPVLVWYLRRHWPGREEGIPYRMPDRIAENA